MESTPGEVEVVQPQIGLWDAISIIVGIIIGVGIFATPTDVFQAAPGPWQALAVWVAGGLLPLVGALCFAELASTYPRSGGEYVYLTRAYGAKIGFLYAWAQLTVIRPASIAAVAYVCAMYAAKVWHLGPTGITVFAAATVFLLALINLLGVSLGKHTQNVLTAVKLLGLLAIVFVGLLWAPTHVVVSANSAISASGPMGQIFWLAKAMIFVLWTYSGWHEAAYVAAEVKNARRNLPLALLMGTGIVMLIYLLINVAILVGLGFEGARSEAPFVDLLDAVLGKTAANIFNLAVIVSALGAINGMIFTTARIYVAFGEDHALFAPLSHWSRRLKTPARALIVEGVLSLAFVLGVNLISATAQGIDAHGEITAASESFDALVYGTAAVFWVFFLMTGVALFVLRVKDAGLTRPFRTPAYPLMPALFCGWCACMTLASILVAPEESLIGLGIILAGLPFCFFSRPSRRNKTRKSESLLTGPESQPVNADTG